MKTLDSKNKMNILVCTLATVCAVLFNIGFIMNNLPLQLITLLFIIITLVVEKKRVELNADKVKSLTPTMRIIIVVSVFIYTRVLRSFYIPVAYKIIIAVAFFIIFFVLLIKNVFID